MRRFFAVACLLALFCIPLAPAFADSPRKPTFLLKAATLAPKRVGWSIEVERVFQPAVLECSGGDVFVKPYYGGILGTEEEVIAKMRKGQVEVGGFSGRGSVLACPEFSVVELPFLFGGYDEVDFIRQDMFPDFSALFSKNGFTLIMWVDQDFDQIYSVSRPLGTLEAFRGAAFLSWYGPLEEKLLKDLGARVKTGDVPEVMRDLREGAGDALIAPAAYMLGGQNYSVVRYINPAAIRYSPVSIVVRPDVWNAIPQAYKDCFWEKRTEMQKIFNVHVRSDNERSLKAMAEYGLKITEMDPLTLQELRLRCLPVYKEMTSVLYPQSLLDEVQKRLADFRARKGRK
ncbi:MAG: TRAP transporter substrate-binding protein DctP [Thermodesulfobacteriota bacterium]